MNKNLFEEVYEGIQEAKKAYYAASDEDGQNAAFAMYEKALEKVKGLRGAESRLWKAYETARDCGNEHIDICDAIAPKSVKHLIACMREYGFEAFTFSSSWSSAVEIAWLFQKEGCTLAGLVEINGQHKAFLGDGFERIHGYLFKLN